MRMGKTLFSFLEVFFSGPFSQLLGLALAFFPWDPFGDGQWQNPSCLPAHQSAQQRQRQRKENKAGGTAGDRAASREKRPAAGTKQEPASLASPASWRLQVRFGRGRIASAGMDEHRPGHPGKDLPARPRPECVPY